MGGVSLPEGDSLYGSLSTEFIEVGGLVEDVESRDLTGYVAVEGEGVKGVFVFSDGDPVGGVYKGAEMEPDEIDEGIGSVIEDGYRLRAVSVPDRLTVAVTASVVGESVHESLHTDYVDPRGFLDDFEDDGFTGSVVLRSDREGIYGVLHLRNGEPFSSAVQTSQGLREGVGAAVEAMDDDDNDVRVGVYEHDHLEETEEIVTNDGADDTGYAYGRSVTAVRDSLSEVSGDIPFMTALEETVDDRGIERVEVDGDRVVVDAEADPERLTEAIEEALKSTETVLRVTQQNLDDGEARRRAVEALREETDERSNGVAEEILEEMGEIEG